MVDINDINNETSVKLDKDYFDCPNCGIKNVSYSIESNESEAWHDFPEDVNYSRLGIKHIIVRCERKDCNRLTYYQVISDWNKKDIGWEKVDNIILFQYPSGKSELPDYIPEGIRKYYKEAIEAYNFGLLNSASIMCRKVIYELCDKKKSSGSNYKEKIKNLGLDKRITDPLLNIKNIGDDTVHAKGWDKKTIEKAIDALGIIINMVYIQEERIKFLQSPLLVENH